MKVNAAVFSFKRLFIKDKSLLVAFISALTGILSGPLIYAFVLENSDNPVFDIFISFNIEFINKTDIEIFSGITASVLVYFFTLFLSGSSLIGRPICLFATFFKTLGIGALIALLYVQYGLKGLEYVLLVFFPGKCILLFAAVLMTKNSFNMSTVVKNGIHEKGSTPSAVKAYYLKSLIIMLIFILSATVDFITIKIFSNLFDFTIQ